MGEDLPGEVALGTHVASEGPGELFLILDAWALSPRDLVSIILKHGPCDFNIQPGSRTTDPLPPPLHVVNA